MLKFKVYKWRVYEKKRGISLIVLVITIIIIIILAGAVILNLVDNNPIDNAVKAKEAYEDKNAIQVIEAYKLQLKMDTHETLKDKLIEDGNVNQKELDEKGIYNITNNVIVVSNFEGLKEISKNVEKGMDYSGKYVYVVNDIDCNSTFDVETGELLSGENFNPIGDSNCRIENEGNEGSVIKAFNGTFDGMDYTINNLYIKDNAATDFCTGLFGYVGSEGIVKNLTIDNSYIQGYYEIGAIVGRNKGKIVNCINKSTIIGDYHLAGGIAGRNTNLIDNCKNYGKVIGKTDMFTSQIGGIVGNCDFGENIIVNNCYNYGNIEADTINVGGIAGGTFSTTVEINNCKNYGSVIGGKRVGGIVGWCQLSKITNSTNVGKITADSESQKSELVGGIVGWLADGTILNCANTGEVYLSKNGFYGAGGIVGRIGNSVKGGTIKNCYNTGEVYTIKTEDNEVQQIGGICGNADACEDKVANIINCYNTGYIYGGVHVAGILALGNYCNIQNCYNVGKLDEDAFRTGGIVACWGDNAIIENNYWLSTCGAEYGIHQTSSNEGAKSKSTAEMKNLASVLGYTYESSLSINDGFPYLKDNKPE